MRKPAQVLSVEPRQLVRIEARVCFGDAVQRESLDQFRIIKNLLIGSGGPSEQSQEISQGLRHDAQFLIGHDRCRAVAFAQAGLVRAEDQRQMREYRKRGPQCAVEQQLFGSVGNVIGSSNHVADPHVDIVDNNAEMVGWVAVRTEKYEIFDRVVFDGNFRGDVFQPLRPRFTNLCHVQVFRRIAKVAGQHQG